MCAHFWINFRPSHQLAWRVRFILIKGHGLLNCVCRSYAGLLKLTLYDRIRLIDVQRMYICLFFLITQCVSIISETTAWNETTIIIINQTKIGLLPFYLSRKPLTLGSSHQLTCVLGHSIREKSVAFLATIIDISNLNTRRKYISSSTWD